MSNGSPFLSRHRPRDQLVRYDRILKDVVMCAQKEYLHGVGIAKVNSVLHCTVYTSIGD